MKRDFIVVDDFYEDPEAVVAHALTLPYYAPYDYGEPKDEKISWLTSVFLSQRECKFKSSPALRAKFEALVGEEIDLEFWNREFPVNGLGYPLARYRQMTGYEKGAKWHCCFHSKRSNRDSGRLPHNHTDADPCNSVGPEGWVGIVYLSKDAPLDRGLTTWRNKKPERNLDWRTSRDEWDPVDQLANVYNRLILHRGYLPHSGEFGWHGGLGRFFQTFFFRTKREKPWASVKNSDLGL